DKPTARTARFDDDDVPRKRAEPTPPLVMAWILPVLVCGTTMTSLLAAGLWTQAPVRNGGRGLGITGMVLTAMQFFLLAVFLTPLVVPSEFLSARSRGPDMEHFIWAFYLCEWARQVALAWTLFAVATSVPRPDAPRIGALVLALGFCLLPLALSLY